MSTLPPGYPPLPPGTIVFGPKGNCTLDICPVEISIYKYRPSFAANMSFIALYSLATMIHVYLGIRWRSWFFMGCMILGCSSAIIGYIGRVLMYYNPFNFAAFMLQIICVTTVPVYYTAAIYVTIAFTIQHFSPGLSRFKPKLFYWIFIPCDFTSLAIQAAGGGLLTSSRGTSNIGVNLSLAGLAFQVFTMVVFCAFFGDYMWRYFSSDLATRLSTRMKLFFTFLTIAVLLILARCAYRLAELHEGFSGGLVKDEALFIGFEGVLVLASTFCLMVGHPGLVFKKGGKGAETGIGDGYAMEAMGSTSR